LLRQPTKRARQERVRQRLSRRLQLARAPVARLQVLATGAAGGGEGASLLQPVKVSAPRAAINIGRFMCWFTSG